MFGLRLVSQEKVLQRSLFTDSTTKNSGSTKLFIFPDTITKIDNKLKKKLRKNPTKPKILH